MASNSPFKQTRRRTSNRETIRRLLRYLGFQRRVDSRAIVVRAQGGSEVWFALLKKCVVWKGVPPAVGSRIMAGDVTGQPPPSGFWRKRLGADRIGRTEAGQFLDGSQEKIPCGGGLKAGATVRMVRDDLRAIGFRARVPTRLSACTWPGGIAASALGILANSVQLNSFWWIRCRNR